jgi:hypothetical protein
VGVQPCPIQVADFGIEAWAMPLRRGCMRVGLTRLQRSVDDVARGEGTCGTSNMDILLSSFSEEFWNLW